MSKSGSKGRRHSRPTAAQSFLASSEGPTTSRFHNMLNPMNSAYNGYTQASQSAIEEDDEATEDVDLETGRSIFHSTHEARPSAKSQGKRRVAWNPGASELNDLHPNIHREDKLHGQDSSDDEVPQAFKVEAPPHIVRSPTPVETSRKPEPQRLQPLSSHPGRKTPSKPTPILPTTLSDRTSTVKSPQPIPSQRRENASSHTGSPVPSHRSSAPRQRTTMGGLDDYEKALWSWVNVYNLDAFLQEVYWYYEGKGIVSIGIARGLNLLTVGFVIAFSTFLLRCIDYSSLRIHKHSQLSDVVIPHCVSRFSGFTLIFFLLFIGFYIWQIWTFIVGMIRLMDMYKFYTHLLKIPDADIQTISWSEVVRRIGAIREENPLTAISSKKGRASDDTATAKLDAHDIANRILRQENYLIALFNKELLDLRVPLPALLKRFVVEEKGKGKLLTQALEWNLRFCLMQYLFDKQGKVRKFFLQHKNRTALIAGLQRRFIFVGILNAIFAPFIVLYLLMYSFFRYFEQYHKDPSAFGGRRYTLFAQWKFREFNELPHIFARRLDESYPVSNMYIGQFPNEKITLLMRFVAFIAGSFAAVLVLATVIDPDLFLNFEITPHRTVFFYLGVFGAVLTAARGMIPEDNRVFDPELLMTEVINYTHYMPDEWKGQLHSKKVHQEFGELFSMKVLIFVQEIVSVILTPFVLWFSLPKCAPAIIDFFREFSVHVDGRGYVCSFAEFNFERHGNVKFGVPTSNAPRNKEMVSNEGKMEKSFLNFKAANPDWNPTDPSGSLFLTRMADINAMHRYPYYHQHPVLGRRGSAEAHYFGHAGQRHDFQQPGMEASNTTDRAYDYDRDGLRQSRLHMSAAIRRRGPALGQTMSAGSVVGMSTLLATGNQQQHMGQSVFMDPANAPSVTLGDSQGSQHLVDRKVASSKEGMRKSSEAIPIADLAPDGGVGSGLGESYVDGGANRYVAKDEEEEEMEDGGVLGLLAQIYGRRDGPTVVI